MALTFELDIDINRLAKHLGKCRFVQKLMSGSRTDTHTGQIALPGPLNRSVGEYERISEVSCSAAAGRVCGVAGKFGNMLDGKAGKDLTADSERGDSDSDSDVEKGGGARQTLLHQKKKEEDELCISYSVTKPCCMQTMDRSYGYIPIDGTKPCLYTVAMFEDFRKRHLHSNILSRIYEDLVTHFTLSVCIVDLSIRSSVSSKRPQSRRTDHLAILWPTVNILTGCYLFAVSNSGLVFYTKRVSTTPSQPRPLPSPTPFGS